MKPNTTRTKFAAQDAVLSAIKREAGLVNHQPELQQAINDIGQKLADKWGVRNYPASGGAITANTQTTLVGEKPL